MNWKIKASEWLHGKAEEQAKNNERWPEHAMCYPSWTERVNQIRLLAIELERSPHEPEGEEIARLRDVFPAAHRLALELECLLLDTKDTVAVSKWWDSAHEALEQWREIIREDSKTPNARLTGAEPEAERPS